MPVPRRSMGTGAGAWETNLLSTNKSTLLSLIYNAARQARTFFAIPEACFLPNPELRQSEQELSATTAFRTVVQVYDRMPHMGIISTNRPIKSAICGLTPFRTTVGVFIIESPFRFQCRFGDIVNGILEISKPLDCKWRKKINGFCFASISFANDPHRRQGDLASRMALQRF